MKTLNIESFTLEYFSEFGEFGEYIPDFNRLLTHLSKYGVSITAILGYGDSGIAYELSNGDVLKITSNHNEGRISHYFKANKSEHIINYKSVWREGDLYFIIMDKIECMATDSPEISSVIKKIYNKMDSLNSYSLDKVISLIKCDKDIPLTFKSQILSYLNDLYQSNITGISDIINLGNIGLSSGKLIFFDIS